MKVLHVLGSNSFSGAENVACQIINMTKDFTESIYVSRDGPIRAVLESKNIRYIMLDHLGVAGFTKVLKTERPDIIHAHDMKASFICSIAVDKNTKFISHIHNNNYNSRRITIKSILFAFAASRANNILWVSKSSYEGYYFSKFFKCKSTILYNVIDTSEIVEKINNDKTEYCNDIIFVGRLVYQKNPQKFVEIVAKLKKQFPKIKAAMIGSGKYYNEVVSLIEKNKVKENISLLGFIDNPYKIMSNSKIMVITSEWEGTPMCALEAMFLGLPIISTPVDGMKDLIKENVNGFFARDDNEFVKFITHVLINTDLQQKLSEGAKKIFSELNSYQQYAEQVTYLYTNDNYTKH